MQRWTGFQEKGGSSNWEGFGEVEGVVTIHIPPNSEPSCPWTQERIRSRVTLKFKNGMLLTSICSLQYSNPMSLSIFFTVFRAFLKLPRLLTGSWNIVSIGKKNLSQSQNMNNLSKLLIPRMTGSQTLAPSVRRGPHLVYGTLTAGGQSWVLAGLPYLVRGQFYLSLGAQVWLDFNNPLRDELEVGEWKQYQSAILNQIKYAFLLVMLDLQT